MAVWLRQIQTGVAYVVLLFLLWTDGYQCSRITGTACALQDGTKVNQWVILWGSWAFFLPCRYPQFTRHAGQWHAKFCSVVGCLVANDRDNVISHRRFVMFTCFCALPFLGACAISNGFSYTCTCKLVLITVQLILCVCVCMIFNHMILPNSNRREQVFQVGVEAPRFLTSNCKCSINHS